MTLPAGWIENPADEGQSGAQVAFALQLASGARDGIIDGDPVPSTVTMSPHDLARAEAAAPGAGTVIGYGDCTIAGGQASFFESTVALLGMESDGYSLYTAHGRKTVRLLIEFPMTSRASIMPQVKSILGSWQWDKP